MAKCTICNSKKGKRICRISNTFICSSCCGKTRNEESCLGCEFYKSIKQLRKYKDIPRFSTQAMEDNFDLTTYANVIESSICTIDINNNKNLKDDISIKILELLIDKYYFNDSDPVSDNEVVNQGYKLVQNAIYEDLDDISDEIILKIIGAIHFVARRRSMGNREYLDFIHGFVGRRVGKGMRVMDFNGLKKSNLFQLL